MELLTKFQMYDLDGSGSLNAYEFVTMVRQLRDIYSSEGESSSAAGKIFSDSSVARFFRIVDKDRSGCISDCELFEAIRGHPNPHRQACIDYMFNLIDVDKDGSIDFGEAIEFYSTHSLNKGELGTGNRTSSGIDGSERIQTGGKGTKKPNNAAARRFIDHFDKRAHTAGTVDVASDEVNVDSKPKDADLIERDGKISTAEFQLYWANRSFYVDEDQAFMEEMETDFGVNLKDEDATEWISKRKAELEAQEKMSKMCIENNGKAEEAGASETRRAVAPQEPAPSAAFSPQPGRKLVSQASNVGNEVAIISQELSKVQDLLSQQRKQWKTDVESRDTLIAEQAAVIAELKNKVEDLEIKLAL